MQVAVKDIKKDDEFWDGKHVWTALTDAEEATMIGGEPAIAILVRFETDGGSDYRKWDDPNIVLEIRRTPEHIKNWAIDGTSLLVVKEDGTTFRD